MKLKLSGIKGLSRKRRILLIITTVLFVLFSLGGGYLLWRVNQPETVAPEESEAGPGCQCCCGTDCKNPPVAGQCYWESVCVANFGPCGCHGWGDPYSCSEYGKCGTRNGHSYTWSQTSWSAGTFCERGTTTPSSPAFPSAGSTTTWRCVGLGASPSCSASRAAVPTFTVTYNGGGGTCTPSSRSVSHGGTSASPSCSRTGHTLANFTRTAGSGGTLNTSTGAVTNVSGTQTIRANWTINTYTVRYTPGDHGRIEGNLQQTVNYGGSATSVQAVPNSGYLFGGWSDGKTERTRTDSNITSNISVTAIFSLSCGNNICDPEENAQNCPVDCPAVCPDGFCTHDENALNCPEDCSGVCGDGFCTHDETNETCPEDCPANCGDGYCDPETENSANCPDDCSAVCGDGYCTHDETQETCPEDCGDVPSEAPVVPTGGTVPETGIFDDTRMAVIVGSVLVFLGFTWIWLGRGMYGAINYLGQLPRKTVRSIKEFRENNIAKRRYSKMSERRKKFEKRVGKNI